jgi:hypothetical protein
MSSIATLLQAAKYIEWYERSMSREWQNLPDELILKILSYSEVEDLISCGQVSKRTRNISRDTSLWVTANLEEKIVKTELLELILSKGCKILNISDSDIVGSFSSNIESQLRVLSLSQSAWGYPARDCPDGQKGQDQVYYEENIDALEKLLSSCCSLQQLEMKGLLITPEMAVSICKNGQTLQTLNLKSSFIDESSYPISLMYILDYTAPIGNFEAIIKFCQELKEIDLNCFINNLNWRIESWLKDDNLKFLATNIASNIEKLDLRNHDVRDDHVKILLSRCNKINELKIEAYFTTDDSLRYIRQYLNLTLEELSLVCDNPDRNISFTSLLELKSMSKLKILNIYSNNECGEIIENLSWHLPHIKISRGFVHKGMALMEKDITVQDFIFEPHPPNFEKFCDF